MSEPPIAAPVSRVPDGDAYFAEVFDNYRAHVNPYLADFLAFAGFGAEVYGEGCYIEDHEGRRSLDCLGGYGTFALGHRHPKVVAAVKDQLDSLALSGKAFFSRPAADLAAELAGVEFATDDVAELTVVQMLERGMCAAFTLNNPRVIRLEPPLIISEDDVRKAVEIMDAALTETSELLATPA